MTGSEIIKRFLEEHPDLANKLYWRVMERDGQCRVCSKEIQQVIEMNESFIAVNYQHDCVFNIDHVIPRSFDGSSAFHNVRATCRPCNEKRGSEYIFIDQGHVVPADYYEQIFSKEKNKDITGHWPDWKPYYGY